MATTRIRVNATGWQRALILLKDRAAMACVRAINRSLTSARVVMRRNTAADLGLRQGDIEKHIKTEPARKGNLRGAVVATGARIRLIKFNARDRRPRGVTA